MLFRKLLIPTFILVFLAAAGCTISSQPDQITVTVLDSGKNNSYSFPAGVTTEEVLVSISAEISQLDKVTPALTTVLVDGAEITIVRVTEEFEVLEDTLPFEQQTVKNESIAEGQTILIQSGVNGKQLTTYRILYEDGAEVSRSIVKLEIVSPSVPEIVMIGVQSPFAAIEINGTLAYISNSNAWVMEGNTGNRRIVVSTSDLDGRVFSISPDFEWLLFSRSSLEEDRINSLWIVNLLDENAEPIPTNVNNVVHFGDWIPGKIRTFAYSTVEPRSTPPGWQANNDLITYQFDSDGKQVDNKTIVETNAGGQYGWWGTIYQWSPDGSRVAYTRPDGIGIVNISDGTYEPLIEFSPYQASTDWAWVPGISWSPDNEVIFYSSREDAAQGSSFGLSGFLVQKQTSVKLVGDAGLFAYPMTSPFTQTLDYQLGYLAAIVPEESETSRYSLRTMDRDGSNQRKLYPGEGKQGLDPQTISWAPRFNDSTTQFLAFISQGNLFVAEMESANVRQITSDGSITRITWR